MPAAAPVIRQTLPASRRGDAGSLLAGFGGSVTGPLRIRRSRAAAL
jgi:hypothetical protein